MDHSAVLSEKSPQKGFRSALATAGAMENCEKQELRAELTRLLQKQTEILESRTFGMASETDLIEYDLRQRAIQDLRVQLAKLTKS